MPEIDLEPQRYRSDRPRVISRSQAKLYLALFAIALVFFYWLTLGSDAWYGPLTLIVPSMFIGALITRLWPLLFLDAKD